MMSAREIRAYANLFRQHVQSRPEVLSVGAGELEDKGQYCIFVSLNERLMRHWNGFPDHVMVRGKRIEVKTELNVPEAFQMADGTLDGSDFLIASGVGRVGTLGLVMRDAQSDKLYGLTNAHVVTRPDESHVGDRVEAVLDGVRQDIGHVAYHSAYRSGGVNRVDLALIELNATGKARAQEFEVQTFRGPVVGSGGLSFSRFAGSRRPHAYGASTQSARHVVPCAAPVEFSQIALQDATGTIVRFGRAFKLTASGPGVRRGHSGALIVREMQDQTLIAVGLLAGGQGSTAVAFSMADVLRELSRAGIEVA